MIGDKAMEELKCISQYEALKVESKITCKSTDQCKGGVKVTITVEFTKSDDVDEQSKEKIMSIVLPDEMYKK
jgi:hypothetical protein